MTTKERSLPITTRPQKCMLLKRNGSGMGIVFFGRNIITGREQRENYLELK
jgi:hypothetical protein